MANLRAQPRARAARLTRTVILLAGVLSGIACEANSARNEGAAARALREGQAALHTAESRQKLREAVQLYREVGNTAGQAEALFWLATSEKAAKNFPAAVEAVEAALALHTAEVGFFDPTSARLLLGDIQLERGDAAAARAAYEQALQRAEAEHQRYTEAMSRLGLGNSEAALGQPERAREHFARALASMAEDGSAWGQASVFAAVGDFEARQGNVEVARAHYAKAIELHRQALSALEADPNAPQRAMHLGRSRRGAAHVLLASAKLEATQQATEAALRACEEGLKLAALLPTQLPAASSEWAAARDRELLGALEQQRETLRAGRAEPASEAAQRPSPDQVRRAIRAIADGKFAVQAWLVRALQADPSIQIDAVRLVPEEKDGKRVAWRTFGVRPDGVWGLLGFQNGDQLLTVNDIPIVDLATSQEARTALKNASRFHVQFTRQRAARELEIVSE